MTLLRHLTHFILLAAMAVLTACATPDPGEVSPQLVGTPLEGCCTDAETYPRPLIAVADPFAPLIGRTVGAIVMRKGYLQHDDAQAAAVEKMQPLDIVLASSKGRLSGHALPGVFSHTVIYLGTEAQLRDLGIWNDPAIKPLQAQISAGDIFIESDSPGVHLSSTKTVLKTDAIVILRPELSGNGRKRQIIRDLVGRIGMDFDFRFDNATTDKIYCAELANITMPEVDMPTRNLYGRTAVVPNDLAALAAAGGGKLELVAYLRGRPGGWKFASTEQLMADLYKNRRDRPDS